MVLNENLIQDKEPNIGLLIVRCLTTAVCIKNRNESNDDYQKGVVEPYTKVKKTYEELEQAGKAPNIHNAKEAIEMICSVFQTKKVPLDEQEQRMNAILEETGMTQLADAVTYSI